MELNKNQRRRMDDIRFKYYSCVMHSICRGIEEEELIGDLGKILLCKGKYVDLIYNLTLDMYYSVEHGANSMLLKSAFEKSIKNRETFDTYEYLHSMREIVMNSDISGRAVSAILVQLGLIESILIRNPVCGIDSVKGVTFIENSSPTAVDILIGLVFYEIYLRGKAGSVENVVSEKDIKFMHSMMEYVGEEYCQMIGGVLSELSLRDLEVISNHISNSEYANKGVILLENSYRPYTPLDGSRWERESFNDDSNASVLHRSLEYIMDKSFQKENILMNRDRVIKENGVRLRLNSSVDGLEYIDVKEVHEFEEDNHYIYIVGHYASDKAEVNRRIALNLKRPDLAIKMLLYEVDITLVYIVLEWMGLKDYIIKGLRENRDKSLSEEDDRELSDNMIKSMEELYEICIEPGITYEDPKSWNYLEKTDQFNRKKKRVVTRTVGDFEYKLIQVGAYVRRLPSGSSVSEEKKEFARKYMINLKEGYTIVSGFSREQRVKKSNLE